MGSPRYLRQLHITGQFSRGIQIDRASDAQGYVSTDMIANPPDEEAKAWASEWQQRTPAGR